MESDNALDQALAALGDISSRDLDGMLGDDILFASNSDLDQLLNNGQPLPSQYRDSGEINQVEFRDTDNGNLDRLEAFLSTNNAAEPSVVLIEDTETVMATIGDDLTNDVSLNEEPTAVDLSRAGSRLVFEESSTFDESLLTRNQNLETSFARDFAGRQNQENNMPIESLFDDDLDLSEIQIDPESCVRDNEKPSTSKAAAQKEATLFRFFTQMPPPAHSKPSENKRQNISASFPQPMNDEQRESTCASSERVNIEAPEAAEKYAALSLSKSYAISENTRNAFLNLSENLENSNKSSVASTSQPESQQEEQQRQKDTDDDSIANTSVPTEVAGQPRVATLFDSTIPYANDATSVPQSIKQLFDLMKAHYSDFTFVYALSAQLCQDRVPMACYVNVKMALLLSIASCKKNPSIAPIPIILLGNDTYMANFLMMNIGNLAARFVGPADEVKPPTASDGYRNYNWIEADPIQLANGGVYYVGDWSCLKSTRSEKIFKDIETSCVAVERATRIYHLKTAIWAHWRAFKYNAKDQQLFNKFVKVFGIPVCMDNRNQETLVDFMLKQASTEIFESTVDHLSVSADDMRQFLATISERTVDLSAEAANMLQKYFVASRNERPDCLTKQAYPIMKQLAESFAKLSLRHEVLVVDAVGAILMCEDFLQHLYGPGADPPPMLDDGNFVGDIDKHVALFYEWLKNYIEKYCNKDI